MASLHGGQICIGAEPTGKVCGVELDKGTVEDLANKSAKSKSSRSRLSHDQTPAAR
jgi:hypothetical protein